MAKAADVPHVATMLAMMRDADAHPSHSSSNKSASDNGTYNHLDSGLRHTSSQVSGSRPEHDDAAPPRRPLAPTSPFLFVVR